MTIYIYKLGRGFNQSDYDDKLLVAIKSKTKKSTVCTHNSDTFSKCQKRYKMNLNLFP